MNYWNNLAPRERLLLGGAIGTLLFFMVVFFGIRPVLAAKANSQASHNIVIGQMETLQKRLPNASRAVPTTGTQAFNRNAVLQTVRKRNLDLSRIEPGDDGALKIWFDEARSEQVFGFINDITATYATTVTAVQMSRKSDGQMSATLTLRPTGA